MSIKEPKIIRHHLKVRLIPLINRLCHSSWRNRILYINCDDFALAQEKKCIISANEHINHQSDIFQVILQDAVLPFEDQFFDVVVVDLSKYRQKTHSIILREAYRVLKFSGKALICNKNKLSINFIHNLSNKNARSYWSFKRLVLKHHFQVLTEHPLSFVLFNNLEALNKVFIKKEKELRKVVGFLANYHCIQVYKSKDYYQPLPDYLRLSKTLNLTGT